MKTSELIAILERMRDKHGDLPVWCTWEGVVRKIGSIYRTDLNVPEWFDKDGRRVWRPVEVDALVIDAEEQGPVVGTPEEDIGYLMASDDASR
jgi:hypothetical protein